MNGKSWTRFCPVSGTLFARICKDYWIIAALGVSILISFHWIFVTFLPRYDMRYKLVYIRRMPEILKAMIGKDLLDIATTTGLGSFAYLHPMTLAVLLGFAVLLPSGLIVGQIDRGTIELVLSTPLSRKKFMFTTVVAGGVAGVVLVAGMLLGTWLGVKHTELREPYNFGRIVICAVNLYAIYLVALGCSTFFSAVSTIRSWAVGWAFGLCLVAYLIHFTSEWWGWVRKISFLGPLYYYHPIKIATGQYDPSRDIMCMVAASVVLFVVSIVWFSRRDIAVV